MKTKVFIMAILALFFLSCGNRVNNKHLDLDKIEVIKSLEEIRLDSINKLDELKVFGSITFGMNNAEFEKSKNEFIEKSKVFYSDCKGCYQKKIGDYEFYRIEGYFHKEKLYRVEISGQPIGYSVYDNNMRIAYDGLFNVLKNKYGFPNDDLGFPSWHTITDDGRGSAYWLIGDKKIIMVVEPYRNDSYSLKLYIYQPSVSEIIKEESELIKKNTVKKGVDLL